MSKKDIEVNIKKSKKIKTEVTGGSKIVGDRDINMTTEDVNIRLTQEEVEDSDVVVVGEHNIDTTASSAVTDLLSKYSDALKAYLPRDEFQELLDIVEEIRNEIERPEPKPSRLRRLSSSLKEFVVLGNVVGEAREFLENTWHNITDLINQIIT